MREEEKRKIKLLCMKGVCELEKDYCVIRRCGGAVGTYAYRY